MNQTIPALVDDADRALGSRVVWHLPAGAHFAPRRADDIARVRRETAAALVARGVQPGDRVAVIGPTTGNWAIVDLAILSVGAVTVGVYPTSTAAQMRTIVEHARCTAAFVASAEAKAALAPCAMSFVADLDDAGLEAFRKSPSAPSAPSGSTASRASTASMASTAAAATTDELAAEVVKRSAAVAPDDVATIVYTSGTTGEPKGVVLTHRALFVASKVGVETLRMRDDDVGVGFLPLAHVLARVNFYGTLHARTTTWFAKSLEEVADVWRAAHPTAIAVVPRVLEKIQARVLAAVADSPLARQKLFARALEVGVAYVRAKDAGAPVSTRLAAEHALWERLVYRRVRAGLGWDRLRFSLCGGAPLRRDVAEFFQALGVTILEGYGLTETSAASILSLPWAQRLGSVGRPLPGVLVKLDVDGEILLKSPGLFTRYERDEAATRAAFDEDGFFRTGDVGVVDEQGFVRITDRKKDLLVTAGGKNIAPQAVEAAIAADSRVLQAVVVGDAKPYLTALLFIDPVVKDRERAAAEAVAQANATLARYEQVKRWAVIDDELTVEAGLITPTQKIRRRAVTDRYGRIIDGLYAVEEGPRSNGGAGVPPAGDSSPSSGPVDARSVPRSERH